MITILTIAHLVNDLSPEEAQVQVALITSLAGVVGILVTAVIARIATHPKTVKGNPNAKAEEEEAHPTETPLAPYSDAQNDFVRLVVNDSKEVHRRLTELEKTIGVMREERHTFMGAVGRYITKLARAWGHEADMPQPDADDFTILEETLPADWQRS